MILFGFEVIAPWLVYNVWRCIKVDVVEDDHANAILNVDDEDLGIAEEYLEEMHCRFYAPREVLAKPVETDVTPSWHARFLGNLANVVTRDQPGLVGCIQIGQVSCPVSEPVVDNNLRFDVDEIPVPSANKESICYDKADRPTGGYRRVAQKEKFSRVLLAAINAKFPSPKPTEANVKSIQRFAYNYISTYGKWTWLKLCLMSCTWHFYPPKQR